MLNLFNQSVAEIQITWSHKVPVKDRPCIKTSRDVYDILVSNWPNIEYVESFYSVLLSRANKVLGVKLISIGGTAGTVVDPKCVFQAALKSNAAFLVLAHNHPSGNLKPSQADIDLTRKLKQAGAMLDLPVLDHLIITAEAYFSMADDGLI
ncbi:MAG: JAB domain-containing protein [Bacteroidota bacterium]